jgi:hypothetical protein
MRNQVGKYNCLQSAHVKTASKKVNEIIKISFN